MRWSLLFTSHLFVIISVRDIEKREASVEKEKKNMGLTLSQEDIFRPVLSNDIEISLQQVINAFRRDIPFFARNHQTTTKTDSSNIQKEEENIKRKVIHNRSSSLDEKRHSSLLKRQWECQLCKILNENDSQLCSICGSSKINVYIPIINPKEKTINLTDQKRDSSNSNRYI